MNNVYCFKSVRGSAYDLEIKKYLKLVPLWNEVIDKVSALLGNKITKIGRESSELYIDLKEVNDEIAKLFTVDGKLKKNSKKANELRKQYHQIIEDVGLEGFQEKHLINFIYGVMRTGHQQKLESFISNDHEVYLKANYNMLDRDKSNGSIESISELEYHEKYLEGLKNREEEK